jgi:hypothetical protein
MYITRALIGRNLCLDQAICVSAVRRSAGGRSSAGAPAVFYQPEPELLRFLPSSGWKIRMTYITSVILLQENMQYYRTYSTHSLL